jgi:RES domain-containing protein
VRRILRTGAAYRVCDRHWTDPLDTAYSKANGGRWNPPDRGDRPGFGALYLNATRAAARADARRHVRDVFGATAFLEDLSPEVLPDLQHVTIAQAALLDALTHDGIADLGLADTYPEQIPHPPCQGHAAAVYDELDGVAALSAVAPREEEWAIFDRAVSGVVRRGPRVPFAAWWTSAEPEGPADGA